MREFKPLNVDAYCWWCRKPLYNGTDNRPPLRFMGGDVCETCYHSFVHSIYETIVKITGDVNING